VLGLRRNTERLFDHGGKLFLMAMDHAQGGLTDGLEDIRGKAIYHADTEIDGFILNVGLAPIMGEEKKLLGKKLALRTSFGGTMMASEFTSVHLNHVSPENALALGADAVVMMFSIGGDDYKSGQALARDIDAYHRFSIPVIVEILGYDYEKTQTYDVQANGARVAAELGADVVKVFFTEKFDRIVSQCPVPVILAGGPRGSDIIDTAQEAVRDGVRGFAFGRNLFQSENSLELAARLGKILRS
jgi:DhnA family fructose-bisphosphate aldolase class Ia